MLALVSLTLGCQRVVSGVDPEPLGYGPPDASALATGYEDDPVPRPSVTPWTPPERRERARSLNHHGDPEASGQSAPIPYTQEVLMICAHLETLAQDDEREDSDACLRRHRVARVFRTPEGWEALADCILAGADAEAVTSCWAGNEALIAGDEAHPLQSRVCMHVFAVTLLEEFGPEPLLDAAGVVEFEPLLDDCIETFVQEQRDARDPAAYADMMTCVGTARSSAAIEACE